MALILGEPAALASVHSWLRNCTIRMRVQTTTVVTIDVIIPHLLRVFSKCEAHGPVNRRRALYDSGVDRRRPLPSTRVRCRGPRVALVNRFRAISPLASVPSQGCAGALLPAEPLGASAKGHWRVPPMPQCCWSPPMLRYQSLM